MIFLILLFAGITFGQTRSILVPRPIQDSPFSFKDTKQYFGKAWRWFQENQQDSAVSNLKKTIENAGYQMDPAAYYVVVAHFSDTFAPIGLIHGQGTDFFNTRLYGLKEDNLYYVYISQEEGAESFLSVMATEKSSPFSEGLPAFLGLLSNVIQPLDVTENNVWVDVRRFSVPDAFRDFSDLSFIVKKKLSDEQPLATIIFDNTKKERLSFGFAMALTSVRDVDILVGNDGRIIVRPKPDADLAGFAVINWHFWAVDTKQKTLGNSVHALAGFRLADIFEPLIGVGAGFDIGLIDLHIFAGYSFEFTNALKDGFSIGDQVTENRSPFKRKVRGKPRFGLEIKL